MDRMHELVSELNKHNYYYYVLERPIISNKEWDEMYDELELLEKNTGIILPDSPTQRVGDALLSGFSKVTHEVKLFSLDKCRTYEALNDWMINIKNNYADASFSLEYKYDGLRVLLKYENGYFVQASTRGNGYVGEDVTAQIKTIKSVPMSIDYKGKLIVQGEAMITLSNFEKYNKTATEKLKNARNAAAGAIRNLDPKVTASRNLDIFFYDIVLIEDKNKFKTQKQENEFLKQNKFLTGEMFFVSDNADKIILEIESVDNIKSNLDVLIDGMVLKVNQLNYREEIGVTSKFPKWAMAYKFEALEAAVNLEEVIWQVGRTGKITPVGIIEPTELAGAVVTRATLNNYEEILKKQVKINSTVFVRRSNEVIPEILGLAHDNDNSKIIEKPNTCPSCGYKLTDVGPNIFCFNEAACRDQIVGKIAYFASRNCMNIEGLSQKTVGYFYDYCNVKKVSDIYKLTENHLKPLEGFKDKKIKNILSAIQKSKHCNLSNFIDALSINGVGEKTSKDLAKTFNTLDNIKNASLENLQKVKDVGEVIANNIYNFFKNADNLNLIKELKDLGVNITEVVNNKKSNIFDGQKFVLTGTLENITRSEVSKIIESHGGEVVSSVSKNTDYVLAGVDAGSKLTKAKTLNIKVITQQEFFDLIKE